MIKIEIKKVAVITSNCNNNYIAICWKPLKT